MISSGRSESNRNPISRPHSGHLRQPGYPVALRREGPRLCAPSFRRVCPFGWPRLPTIRRRPHQRL